MGKRGAKALPRTSVYLACNQRKDLSGTLQAFSDMKSDEGFTLIELLVVITLIAILSGVVLFSVNFNTKPREVQKAAQQMQALTQVATSEALQLDRLLGVELFSDGYRFLEWVEPAQEQLAEQLAEGDTSTGEVSTQGKRVKNSETDPASSQGINSAANAIVSGYWDLLRDDRFLKQQSFSDAVELELSVAGTEIELLPMDTKVRNSASQSSISQSAERKTFTDNGSLDNKKPDYLPTLIFYPTGEATDFELILSSKDNSRYKFYLRGDVLGHIQLQKPGEEESSTDLINNQGNLNKKFSLGAKK